MNTSIQHSESDGIVQSSVGLPQNKESLPVRFIPHCLHSLVLLLAGAFLLLCSEPAARADRVPANCNGSGLGITLFTSAPDVHIGDTLHYSINVFNGLPNSGRIVCDATEIQAWIVTPDGKTNTVTLLRRTLHQAESDFYPDVVSYVVRAQDIQPDATLRARAYDSGVIHQNDTNSQGGGEQGVNTEVNMPCILLTAQCVGTVGETGAIIFSGTVTNCGNNTLVGVTVTNYDNSGQFSVQFLTNLALGQMATFTGTWIPYNACNPSTVTLIARASDEFTSTPRLVTNSATATCQNVLTPGIKVTKVCPVQTAISGQLLTFSGSVSNTGNVTLTNIVVVNDQPAANTAVYTLASLAPGAVASFTGSYLAPAECSVTDTLTARASSICGAAVTSTASATCPVQTEPALEVTQACPATSVFPGGILTYSGTVHNAGNITLTNIVVVNNWPASNTVIFTQSTLAPGGTANFTGSYQVPTNCCVVWMTTMARGQGCVGETVTATTTRTCAALTLPKIVVNKTCAPGPLRPGSLLDYSGTVSNAGSVTLINVTVVNDQSPAGSPLLGPINLAPGEFASYKGSYIVPPDFCGTDTVTANGLDSCTMAPVASSVKTACPIVMNPRIAVTQLCPPQLTPHGGQLIFSGTVSNPGNVTLVNVYVVNNQPSNNTPVIGPITLAPGAFYNFTGSYTAPELCCEMTGTLTARGQDRCTSINVTATATAICPLPL